MMLLPEWPQRLVNRPHIRSATDQLEQQQQEMTMSAQSMPMMSRNLSFRVCIPLRHTMPSRLPYCLDSLYTWGVICQCHVSCLFKHSAFVCSKVKGCKQAGAKTRYMYSMSDVDKLPSGFWRAGGMLKSLDLQDNIKVRRIQYVASSMTIKCDHGEQSSCLMIMNTRVIGVNSLLEMVSDDKSPIYVDFKSLEY